jgi:hypothetical protein
LDQTGRRVEGKQSAITCTCRSQSLRFTAVSNARQGDGRTGAGRLRRRSAMRRVGVDSVLP